MEPEKPLDQRITELDATIRYLIGNAQLSPTIVELILRNIHQEVSALAEINLKKQREDAQKANENKERDDGDSTEH